MQGAFRMLVLTLVALLMSSGLVAAQTVLWGTIFSLSPGQPPRLVLHVDRQLMPITVLPTTLIQIRTQTGQLVTIGFSDLRVGDEVTVTVTPTREATAMTVVGRTVTSLPSSPAAGPASPGAGGASSSPPAPSPSAQSEIAVSVPEGVFVFRNLTITRAQPDATAIGLEGEVVNRTTKVWTQAIFEMTLFDAAGRRIGNTMAGGGPFTLTAERLVVGRAKRFQEPSFGAIPTGTTVASLHVAFRKGSYPAVYVFELAAPHKSPRTAFEDARLKIEFSISREFIEFTLRNKLPAPLRIDWNKVTYVDPSGKAQRVIHKGVGFNDRDRPQAPTMVASGVTVRDVVLPTGHIASGRDWIPLFPEAPAANDYVGKTFKILLPLEVGSAVYPYTFVFRIRQVKS